MCLQSCCVVLREDPGALPCRSGEFFPWAGWLETEPWVKHGCCSLLLCVCKGGKYLWEDFLSMLSGWMLVAMSFVNYFERKTLLTRLAILPLEGGCVNPQEILKAGGNSLAQIIEIAQAEILPAGSKELTLQVGVPMLSCPSSHKSHFSYWLPLSNISLMLKPPLCLQLSYFCFPATANPIWIFIY